MFKKLLKHPNTTEEYFSRVESPYQQYVKVLHHDDEGNEGVLIVEEGNPAIIIGEILVSERGFQAYSRFYDLVLTLPDPETAAYSLARRHEEYKDELQATDVRVERNLQALRSWWEDTPERA